jgi:hypothetical protein
VLNFLFGEEKRRGWCVFGFRKLSHSSRMCPTFQVRVEKKGMTKAGALLLEAADTCLCLVFQTSKFLLLVFKCQEFFSQAPRSINQSINQSSLLTSFTKLASVFLWFFLCSSLFPPMVFVVVVVVMVSQLGTHHQH